MKFQALFKKQWLPAAAAFVFSLICCLSTVLLGDDFLMYYAYEKPEAYTLAFTNGRYLANWLTYALVRWQPAKYVLYTLLLFVLLLLLMRFVQFREKKPALSWLTLGLFVLMPAALFCDTVMWLFAFAVHVVPVIFTLIYMRICFREWSEPPVRFKYLPLLCGVIGFAGEFFTEHISIFNVVFAVFVLIYAAKSKQQHLRGYQITYAVCAAAGLILMLLNPQYGAVADQTESVTYRAISFSYFDILHNIYIRIIPKFAQQYPLLHIIIAGALLLLLSRTEQSGWKKERRRYAKLTMGCVIAYAAFSVVNKFCTPLISLTTAERIPAMETAFAFLYMISVIYLAYILTAQPVFLRVTVYECSILMCALPFCVVNPVTDRCFFIGFCFWLLLAMELFSQASENCPERLKQLGTSCFAVLNCTAMCIISYMLIVNRYVYDLSIDYLKQQLQENTHHFEVLEVPYPDYSYTSDFPDYLKVISDNPEIDAVTDVMKGKSLTLYAWYMCEYNGIFELTQMDKFSILTIPYYSYTM